MSPVGMFMFAALCQRAHRLKHSLAESEKQRKKSSLAEKFVSRVTRQSRYHCIQLHKWSRATTVEENLRALVLKIHVVSSYTCLLQPRVVMNNLKFCRLHHHHHKHQGMNPLIRSVSRVIDALSNVFQVVQLIFFLAVWSCRILQEFGFVAFFVCVEAISFCIRLSCPVCL